MNIPTTLLELYNKILDRAEEFGYLPPPEQCVTL